MELINVDQEIRPLVKALREAGVDTDWSCAGAGDSHMTIRPTIEARTRALPLDRLMMRQKETIEGVMFRLGVTEYWLSLVFAYGGLNTHGGEATWLIQLPGRFDFLALPVAYSLEYIDGEDDLVIDYRPPEFLNPMEMKL